ncbi:MAG: MOSC domain-containing protein [Kineosporiaceae bacterium]|jgi:ferredoxin-NADP reductase/MOSC domain-containing protein YiiM
MESSVSRTGHVPAGGRPARLVSVNVGLPQDVDWNGRTVRTAVWKSPVAGPRIARKLNLDGDGQGDLGGHGGPDRAVLVYQLASYDHWRRELGRDDLVPGIFGENFTVDGLADDEVCIGDRYRIGTALFEVTQPRVTCYRVGLRTAVPRLPSLLVSHRRPGFYLSVLQEGAVQAGDEIVRVATGVHRMTVAAVDALLYLPDRDLDQIARARQIPALSPGWKASFEALLDVGAGGGTTGNAGLAAATAAPAWSGFRPLRVLERVAESSDVVSVRLGAPDGASLPAALPGQFLTIRLEQPDGRPPVTRSYSLSGPPGAPDYRISVKREPHGLGSGLVHDRLPVGVLAGVAAPRGTFTLEAGERPVLLVSAGVGVTPVLAMLYALAGTGSTRQLWWLHGARNGADHCFAGEAATLLARLPGARSTICYSAPGPGDRIGRDYHHHGRLCADVLADLELPADAEAYVCGPAAFMADVQTALPACGLDPQRVRVENFGPAPSLNPGVVPAVPPSPHQPVGAPGTGPAVTFARSGLIVRWRASDPSLLDLAEACDVPVRWSCRTGVCHNCETAVLDGTARYRPEPIDLPAQGNVLVCCAVPTSDVVLDL